MLSEALCNDSAMRLECTWEAAVAEEASGMFGRGDSRPVRAFFLTSYIRDVERTGETYGDFSSWGDTFGGESTNGVRGRMSLTARS